MANYIYGVGYRGSCLNDCLDAASMFAWGSQWEAWISDLHIVQMNQSLQMTVLQHNRLLLFSFARGSWCVWCAECSAPIPPSCFLSLILLHQWGNVWPCRAKQQLWSQSVRGLFWHCHPQGWFLRWIRHPKETFQAPACSKASSSFFIVLLSPANVEGNGSVFAPRKLFCTAKLSYGLTFKFQRLLFRPELHGCHEITVTPFLSSINNENG